MAKEVEITIKAKMNERWVNDFLSMLKYMESCGNMGHSAVIGFYSDGDGDFRPKFEFDRKYESQHGYWEHELAKQNPGKTELWNWKRLLNSGNATMRKCFKLQREPKRKMMN